MVSVDGAMVDGADGVDDAGRGCSEMEGDGDVQSSVGVGSVPVDGSPIVLVTMEEWPGFVEISTRPPCSMTLCSAECVGGDGLPEGARSVTTTDLPVLLGNLTASLRFSCDSGFILPFTSAVIVF